MHISSLTFEDSLKAARLHQNAFFKGWDKKVFQEFLQTPLIQGLKIEDNHHFSGFILWREVGEEAEILTFVISPAYQHKGLGSLLLNTLLKHLIKRDIIKLFLEVAEDNIKAHSFYIKHGFVLLGKRPNYYPRKKGKHVQALNFFKALVIKDF